MTDLVYYSENLFSCFPCIKEWRAGMDELAHGLRYTLECEKVKLEAEAKGKQTSQKKKNGGGGTNDDDEEEVSVHATLFLEDHAKESDIVEGVDALLKKVNKPSLDCLYLALYPGTVQEQINKMWAKVVELHASQKCKEIAVRDLNKTQLQSLCESTTRKPDAVSVLLDFANENDDFVTYAEESKVEVRTHGVSDHAYLFDVTSTWGESGDDNHRGDSHSKKNTPNHQLHQSPVPKSKSTNNNQHNQHNHNQNESHNHSQSQSQSQINTNNNNNNNNNNNQNNNNNNDNNNAKSSSNKIDEDGDDDLSGLFSKYEFISKYKHAKIRWAVSYGVIVVKRHVVKTQSYIFDISVRNDDAPSPHTPKKIKLDQ